MKILVCGFNPLAVFFYYAFLKAGSEVRFLLEKGDSYGKLSEFVFAYRNKKEKLKLMQVDSGDNFVPHLVLLFSHAYRTSEVCRLIKPFCNENAYIVSFQTGISHFDIIAGILGEDNLALGISNHVIWPVADDVFRYISGGATFIGRRDRKNTLALKKIRQMFPPLVNVKISRNINSLIWSQLVIRTAIDGWGAVLHFKRGKLINNSYSRTLVRMTLAESERIARRKRIKLSYEDAFAKTEGLCEATPEVGSYFLWDLEKGRKTEVDYLNGFIYSLGQDLNIPTPLNFILYQAVRALEK